ncbi:bifunctional orotidine-5'-phosphate decarboxylase/orotate phosphoribosyltransferase [Pleurocapsa sp. CCALA 161]|uniref:bifunctional orotidine-5'-phosphate decarboxylase/orotate phosphoribosyltransferase n=1 Tax=Pleurocapsa sp. CCALA 161 TaxID=2107688 RepID=UPI000D07E20B|nr:bifunctional orotidine-5'-phosphate decarboxylase/orotate phosphoribosyltransferase [Pleurocapsa sp. CCALA 161]PSB09907.1 bifunctional orotidine-5'-phosphate decarboxylase/orotate phosphoribosyltransferase [Pleurocapsa sp. CCALA 161]
MNFTAKLNQAIATNNSLLIVGLDPNPEMMPSKYPQSQDLLEDLETWLLWVIESTSDRVCAYKPTLGFYEALGIAGLQLLERVLAGIPQSIPVILDAKHSDLNTSTVFAKAIFEQWQVDAVTLTPFAGQDHAAPFLVYTDKAVFILAHTSNPQAETLQRYPSFEQPFYLQVVQEAQSWATPEQLYLEVGTTNTEVLGKIRAIAPERTILLRSLWSKKNNLESLINIGLNSMGEGLLIPIPQDFLASNNLATEVANLNHKLNTYRVAKTSQAASCDLWTPDVCLLSFHPYQSLILELFDIGCLLFGEYVQASGATFSYYIDLRKIISNPHLFNQVLDAYGDIVKQLEFDRIAGIPYGALPTATGLALNLQRPMIFPRKEVKAHGTRRLIEGNFHPGEKVVVIDDILISGKSVMEGAEKLKSAGLKIEDIVVFIDHEGGVKDRLKDNGYRAHSVLSISEITDTLYEAGRINQEQYNSFKENH